MTGCEDCGHGVLGACTVHGSFFAVKDRAIPSRARLTAPSLVTIKPVLSTEIKTTSSGSILYDACVHVYCGSALSLTEWPV